MDLTPPTTTTTSTPPVPRRAARSTLRRTAATVAVALLAPLGLATAAEANGFEEVDLPERGFFYADFEADVLLFAGADARDYCGADDRTLPARLFERQDGSRTLKVDGSEQPLRLYATPLGAIEFVETTCAALAAGDDVADPFATGSGTVRVRLTLEPGGTAHMVNGVVGSATAADGTTWRVRARADIQYVDGQPVGSPAEFQRLRVTRTGA